MFSKLFRSETPSDSSSGESSANSPAPKTVYLVMRSQYEVPVGHRVLKFEEPGLLAWFQKYWRKEGVLEELKAPFAIASAMEEWKGRAPADLSQLRKFAATIYSEGGIIFDEHAIQSIHNDDEIDTPWYLFDDSLALRHPERVAYLLHEDWRLPESFASEGIKLDGKDLKHVTEQAGEGSVYGVFLSAYDGGTVTDITGNFRFDGVRLPVFAKYLAEGTSPVKEQWDGTNAAAWPEELLLLRSLVLKSGQESFEGFLRMVSPQDLNHRCKEARELNSFRFGLRTRHGSKKPGSTTIGTSAISDPSRFLEGDADICKKDWQIFEWHLHKLEEKNKSSAWTHSMREPLIQASSHLCQIRFIEDSTLSLSDAKRHHTHTWAYFFFDDLWLAENRVLGESILRYGAGEDVLQVGEDLNE